MTPAQSTTLRVGALLLVLAAVLLAVVAVTVDTSDPADGLEVVDDPTAIELPRLGLFGGEVTVYGAADRPSVAASDLGCRLLSESGSEQSSAKMSHLDVLGQDAAEVDGTAVQPLFSVGSYPSGAVVSCSDADAVTPLAVSRPSTFGDNGAMVRALAASTAVLCLVVALVGWLLTSRRRA